MAISRAQAMRPALNDVIDAVNQINDIEPYITNAVNEWLDEHPEATTTVEDGSITYIKLATSLVDWLMSEYDKRTLYDSFATMFTAGAALGITGNVTESAAWLQRTSTSDGPTTAKSIHGNTIVQDGSLVPVKLDGIETTGFNLFDEQWQVGGIAWATGAETTSTISRRSDFIPVFPDTAYHFHSSDTALGLVWYDANKAKTGSVSTSVTDATKTSPSDARYVRIAAPMAIEQDHVCINLSDPTRNGTYEPHWQGERTIDVASYFPDGMRSVGTTYDELTETAAITRIGERAYQSGDESDPTVVTDGTVTHYALATPTTVEINPPLNFTYRTEHGGTERVMVPTGEQSAPPTLVTAQGYTAESLRDAALATIAPVENGLASTNYAVGAYLVHGGQLCKVTTAIATGESISIGTNVTATTVMAEVLSLTQ